MIIPISVHIATRPTKALTPAPLQWLVIDANCKNQLQNALHHRRQFIQLAAAEIRRERRREVHDARRGEKVPAMD